MPRLDGMEVLRRLRQTSNVPVIMLTSKDDEIDEILGFNLGADDYIRKPFSQRLLIERVKAVLRRANPEEMMGGETGPSTGDPTARAATTARSSAGRLTLDPARHDCLWEGKPVRLTVTEFLLLQSLAQRPGFVKSRDNLMDAAYEDQVYVDDRTIDSHIKRMRKKFREVDPELRRDRNAVWRRLSISRILTPLSGARRVDRRQRFARRGRTRTAGAAGRSARAWVGPSLS